MALIDNLVVDLLALLTCCLNETGLGEIDIKYVLEETLPFQ